MTLATRLFISGVEYIDINDLIVNKTVSQNTAVSNFKANLDSPYGRHKSDFGINNEVKIFGGTSIRGLVGAYGFDNLNGSAVPDFFGLRNGSAISGLYLTGGIIGSAGGFGSPSYMEVSGTAFNFTAVNPISMACWFKLGSDGNDSAVSQPLIVMPFTYLHVRNQTNQINMRYDETIAHVSTHDLGIGAGSQWHHVIGTFDGKSGIQLYVNGILRDADVFTNPPTTNYNERNVGRRNTGFFSGIIDDVRIYNHVLNNEQVTDLYNSGLGAIDKHIFTGTIENILFQGQELNENVSLYGNDYSSRLLDNTISPTVYTNTEVGSIVRDIITNNTTEIGSSYINSTTTNLKRIAFNEVPIYDSIQQLADLSGYTFYIDNDKQLHFELAGSASTGVTLGSENILRTIFDKTKEGMANVVKVYGDRYLVAAPRESQVVTSQGSVFTLQYKPHSTNVSTSLTNGSLLKGGIFELNATVYSGTDYLINFDDKQIIIISGNNSLINYNNLPPNNGSIVVDYDRSIPIVKAAENILSKRIYGAKSKIINDKSIKDPNTAKKILDTEIQKSDPLNNLQIDLKGWYNLEPGQTINLSIPNFNITESGIPIVQVGYNFNQESVQENKVLNVILDKRPVDLTDKIREISQRLEALESQDRIQTDILTRLQYSTGSVFIVGSSWYVSMKWNGSEFRLWDNSNVPPLGSDFTPRLGLLASGDITHPSWVGSVSYLASGVFGYGPFVQISGGYYG